MVKPRQLIVGVLTIAMIFIFATATVGFYFAQYAEVSPMSSFFRNGTVERLGRYPLEITPSEWTFWIWTPVFGWQVLWILYLVTTMCRPFAPRVFSPYFFIFNMLAYCFTFGWVMLWSREMINWAFGFILTATACVCSALGCLYCRFNNLLKGMKRFPAGDHCAVEVLAINGMALYASWATFTTLQGAGIVGTYTAGVRDHVMSTIVLTGLAAIIVFWFCLDNFVFWESTLHTVTVYPALVVGFAGTFYRFWDKTERNSIFNVVLLGVTGLMCLFKVGHIIMRACWDNKKRRRHILAEEEKFDL